MHRDTRTRIGAIRPDEIANWALRLVRAPSPNPPLGTWAAAKAASLIIRSAVSRVVLVLSEAEDQVVNLENIQDRGVLIGSG